MKSAAVSHTDPVLAYSALEVYSYSANYFILECIQVFDWEVKDLGEKLGLHPGKSILMWYSFWRFPSGEILNSTDDQY